jgi:hypothetical protein
VHRGRRRQGARRRRAVELDAQYHSTVTGAEVKAGAGAELAQTAQRAGGGGGGGGLTKRKKRERRPKKKSKALGGKASQGEGVRRPLHSPIARGPGGHSSAAVAGALGGADAVSFGAPFASPPRAGRWEQAAKWQGGGRAVEWAGAGAYYASRGGTVSSLSKQTVPVEQALQSSLLALEVRRALHCTALHTSALRCPALHAMPLHYTRCATDERAGLGGAPPLYSVQARRARYGHRAAKVVDG